MNRCSKDKKKLYDKMKKNNDLIKDYYFYLKLIHFDLKF